MKYRVCRVLLALLLALALTFPMGLAEEEVVSGPVEDAVPEALEDELWTEDIAAAQEDESGTDAGQTAVAAPEGACTRAQFAAWYEDAKARTAGADHLLGPDGDINNNAVSIILPGESIAVLPGYSLDKDGEYSIQGGIMSFGFTIYQLNDEKPVTESFGVKLLPRTPLPASTKLTETAWETMPVPYGARIGLTEVEDGSALDIHYTSRYVNNTGLPIMLLSSELGQWTGAGKMLGMGGSHGTYSFQGRGDICYSPTFYFLENAYLLTLDTSTVLITSGEADPEHGEGLLWPNGTPQATISLPVDGQAHTFELPSPIRKGYHFYGWRSKDLYGWPWGMLAFPGGTTQNDAPYDCCTSVMSEGKTTVTLNLTRSILKYEGFAQRMANLHDYVLAPTFMTPNGDRDGLTLGFNPQGGTIYGKDYYLCETKGIAGRFSVDITKIVPVREGYAFKGWCTDPAEPVESFIDDPSEAGAYYWARKGHTELYAVWEGGSTPSQPTEPAPSPTEPTVPPTEASKDLGAAVIAVKDATWTGKALKPAVTVTLNGAVLGKANYTVKYKNNKNIGTATVTVTGKGSYTGSATATFKITPKKISGLKLKGEKKKITASWKKTDGGAGYQIQYSLYKDFKSAKTVTVSKSATLKKVLKSLKSGKTYYVRIRGYKKVGGKAYTSAWSKKLSAKVK